MEKKNQLKSCCKKIMSFHDAPLPSSRSVSMRDIRGAKDASLYPGFARAASTGMTPNFKGVGPGLRPSGAPLRSGFTLIELLVVVLIIGILASVALPQYNKAVEKSRATQALTMLKTVYDAAKAYQLANGEWPTSFDELAVDIPWTGNQNGIALGEHRQGKSNADWSIQIRNSGNGAIARGIAVSRISGPYAGATFYLFAVTHIPQLSPDELLCIENRGSALSPFNKTKGDYCKKIMKAEPIHTSADGWWDYFRMP